MKIIKIKYQYPEQQKLEKINVGDWHDLRCAIDTFIPKGKYAQIPLGIAMELPAGCEALVAPRSSTFKNYGIIMTNSLGIIDNSYCGNEDYWSFPAYCLEAKSVRNAIPGTFIKAGDRICQFRIIENQPQIQFVPVEYLENENRGGIGSTGVK